MGPSRKDLRSRACGFSHSDVELTVVADLSFGLERLLAVQRNDIGIDSEGDNGGGGVGKLLGDEHSGSPVLKQEEHQSVPDDALEHHDLDHQTAGIVAVHALQKGDPHDERVGERGEREESDGPLEGPSGADAGPHGEDREDYEFLQRVSGDEAVVHGVGVVGGDEVEGEEGDGEEGDESVDAGALVRREDLPPFDGAVG